MCTTILYLCQCRYMLPLKVYVFSEKKKKGPNANKDKEPSWMPLLQFLQNSASRTTSKLLAETLQPHNYPVKTSHKLYTFSSHRDWTKIIRLALPGLDHCPNFLSPLKMPLPLDNRKQSREQVTHIPKRWDGWVLAIQWAMDVCHCFRGLVASCYWSCSDKKPSKGD